MIAKIEKPEAVDDFANILGVVDGMMIAEAIWRSRLRPGERQCCRRTNQELTRNITFPNYVWPTNDPMHVGAVRVNSAFFGSRGCGSTNARSSRVRASGGTPRSIIEAKYSSIWS